MAEAIELRNTEIAHSLQSRIITAHSHVRQITISQVRREIDAEKDPAAKQKLFDENQGLLSPSVTVKDGNKQPHLHLLSHYHEMTRAKWDYYFKLEPGLQFPLFQFRVEGAPDGYEIPTQYGLIPNRMISPERVDSLSANEYRFQRWYFFNLFGQGQKLDLTDLIRTVQNSPDLEVFPEKITDFSPQASSIDSADQDYIEEWLAKAEDWPAFPQY